jgi:hypothetical protein
MKKLVGFATLLAMTGSALAADLPTKAAALRLHRSNHGISPLAALS